MFEEPNLVCPLSRCSCSCNEYLPQTSLSEHIKHYKIGSKHTLLVLLYVSKIQLYLPRLPTSSNRLNDASLCKRQSHIWPKCFFFFSYHTNPSTLPTFNTVGFCLVSSLLNLRKSFPLCGNFRSCCPLRVIFSL